MVASVPPSRFLAHQRGRGTPSKAAHAGSMAAMDTAAECLLDSATEPVPRAIKGFLLLQDEYIQEDRPLPLAP